MAEIGYARVSSAEQHLELQLDALEKAGCQLFFQDKLSGARDDRPELQKALELAQSGDRLTVWRLDRLGRSLPHLLSTIEALEGRGVRFRSLHESIDTKTASGRLMLHILAALAEFERNLIRERTMAGIAAAKARGHTTRGPRLYGFPDNQQEQALIKEAARRILAGEALGAVIRDWRTREIKTQRGAVVTSTWLRRVLLNPRMVTILGNDFPKVQQIFADPERRKHLGRLSEHLLTGMIRCRCGNRMYVSRSRNGPVYRCMSNGELHGCGQITVSAGALESYITKEALNWLSGDGLVQARKELLSKEPQLNLGDARDELEDLKLISRTRYFTSDHAARIKELETAIKAAERRIIATQDADMLLDLPTLKQELATAWKSWDIDQQRRVLKAVVRKLVIFPSDKHQFSKNRIFMILGTSWQTQPVIHDFGLDRDHETDSRTLSQIAKAL
jgi:DNA invertase Pin-like site-specific DNA recombinase